MKKIYLIDSHCHIHKIDIFNSKKKILKIINKAKKNHVYLFLNVCTSLKEFIYIKNISKSFPNILLSCGIHPLNLSKNNNFNYKKLDKFSSYKKVIAIGETGLDFSHKNINKFVQIDSFLKHIEISKKYKKPIIIHMRNSCKYVINIIKNLNINGMIHCFNETIDKVKIFINKNFFISFSGLVTFKNVFLNEVIKYVPLDKILIETDSPYLSPNPYRGKINEPYNLYYIAKYISKIRKISIIELSYIIKNNFKKLFLNK
ncbi:MAG: TatD family hydrolase [Enterobacteriaceae bacterium]